MSEVVDYDEVGIDPTVDLENNAKIEESEGSVLEATIRQDSLVGGLSKMKTKFDREHHVNQYREILHPEYAFVYANFSDQLDPESPKVDRLTELSSIPESDHKYYDWCETQEDFDYETGQLMQERQDRELLSKHPVSSFVSSLGVGLLEAPFFPFLCSNVSKGISGGLKTAIKTGFKEGAKYGAVSSYIKVGSQELGTSEDIAIETIAGGIFGSCFNAGIYGIGKLARSKYVKALKDKIATTFEESHFKFGASKSPEGVVEVTTTSNGDKSEYNYAEMHPWVQKIIRNNPITQGLGSDSEVLQMFTDTTYRHNFLIGARKEGNYVGLVSVESGKEVRDAIFYDMVERFYEEGGHYIKNHPDQTMTDFKLFVSRNIKEGQKSANANISSASKVYTDWLNKEIDDAVRFKYFDKDPRIKNNLYNEQTSFIPEKIENDFAEVQTYKPTLEYFTTVYNRDVISKNETEFIRRIKIKLQKGNGNYSKEELQQISYSIFDNIMGDNLDKYSLPFRSKEGNVKITKQRKFLTSYEDFQDFEEFLVNDPVEIGNLLRRNLSPGIEFARVSQELFSDDLSEGLSEKTITGKWLFLLEKERDKKLESLTNDKTKELLRQRYKEYAQLISDGELLVRGIYGAPTGYISLRTAQLANGLKMWNYMRQLGGVCISAIVDNKNTVNRFGLGRSFSSLVKSFSKDSAFYVNKADLRKWGAADELARLAMTNKYLEQTDLSAYRNGNVINYLNKASNVFSKATLPNHFNDHNKRIVATLHGTDVIEACLKPTLTKNDAEFLSQARIPFVVRKEIAKRFQENGYFDENGLAVFRLDGWKDDDVTRTFAASLTAASNQTILIPSSGDVPRIFKKMWGKLLFQYKGYQFAMINNVIAPWFNGQNSHAAASIAAGIGLGYMSHYLHSLLSGDPYQHFDDIEFHEGAAERSDLFGYFTDIGSFVKRATNVTRSFGETVERLSPTGALLSDVWYLKNQAIKFFTEKYHRKSIRFSILVHK